MHVLWISLVVFKNLLVNFSEGIKHMKLPRDKQMRISAWQYKCPTLLTKWPYRVKHSNCTALHTLVLHTQVLQNLTLHTPELHTVVLKTPAWHTPVLHTPGLQIPVLPTPVLQHYILQLTHYSITYSIITHSIITHSSINHSCNSCFIGHMFIPGVTLQEGRAYCLQVNRAVFIPI